MVDAISAVSSVSAQHGPLGAEPPVHASNNMDDLMKESHKQMIKLLTNALQAQIQEDNKIKAAQDKQNKKIENGTN